MSGVAGAYFKVMTNTMIIILICSFFVTWIGLPVIYLLLGPARRARRRPPKPGETGEMRAAGKPHLVHRQRWVSWFIRFPVVSFAMMLALIAAVIYIYPRLETGFLPEMDEGSIVLDYNSPPGTSLEETDRILREVEKIIVGTPEVQAYSRRTGTEMGFFITEPNRGDYLIQLKKDRTKTTDDVIEDLRKQIEATQPALRIDFGQVIGDMLGDLMTSVQPIEIKVFGNDQEHLHTLSKQVSDIVSGVDGTADVFNGIVIAGPSVTIEPNYARLAQFGLTPAELQLQLQNSLEGNVVGTVPEKEQLTNIRMVYPGSRTLSVADISRLQIFLPNGELKPITDLANVTVKSGDAEIQRENLQSMGVVTARLEGRDLGSTIKAIQQRIDTHIILPENYHIEYG
jgi:Cu/Ag efflux pump CusA